MTTPKLVFVPGCFDDFEGSQEELDELIALIQSKVDDGSIFTDSVPMEDFDEEDAADFSTFKDESRKIQ